MNVLFSAVNNSFSAAPVVVKPSARDRAPANSTPKFLANADRFVKNDSPQALHFGSMTTLGTGAGTLPPSRVLYNAEATNGQRMSAESVYGLPTATEELPGTDDIVHQVQSILSRELKYPASQPPAAAKSNGFDLEKAVSRKFAENGFLGIDTPEEYGGLGYNALVASSLARAVAYHDLGLATTVLLSSGRGLAGEPLLAHGSEQQKQKYLVPMIEGEKIGAFALTEPDYGSNATNIQAKAEFDAEQQVWRLNGQKIFITNANIADFFIVLARTPDDKLNAFIVDNDSPGLSARPIKKLGQDASDTGYVFLDNVEVPEANLIGSDHSPRHASDPTPALGYKIITKTLEGGRVGVAAMSSGAMQRALDEAVEYVRNRPQFDDALSGKPELLAAKPMLREMLANMALTNELGRLFTYNASRVKDRVEAGELPHSALSMAASMAKLYASEGANKVAADALQLHGGYGFIEEQPISKIYRDVRVMTLYEGTSQIQKLIIGRNLGMIPDLFKPVADVTTLDDIIQQGTALVAQQVLGQVGTLVQKVSRQLSQMNGFANKSEESRTKVALGYAGGTVAQDMLAKVVDLAVERQGVKLLEEQVERLKGHPREVAGALLAMQRFKAAQLAIQTVTELTNDDTLAVNAFPILSKAAKDIRQQRNIVATALTGVSSGHMEVSPFHLIGRKN
ncbi:MAG: acyl-CoA dehydrogenase family protein [Vampirovibrionales bacterium]|nr:acyl-CoA dehydrogenase family protein [Vampirovibrionales bacterium]